VSEYYIFDPLHETLQPALRGYQLVEGEYQPMIGASLSSKVLGLELRAEAGTLRLYDPQTGARLLTPDEAEDKAVHEATQRRAAEVEIARLREELARLRG
ncbi:MAG: Uma2 family endonuclease, partial [candidate division KSB1 bacterium]